MSNSFVTLWTVACQDPLFTGFPRQDYWSGLSFPSPGDLPDPGIEPKSPALAGRFFIMEPPEKPILIPYTYLYHWTLLFGVLSVLYLFSSVTQTCLTLCDPINHSTPRLPVHHKLPEFTQTHAH